MNYSVLVDAGGPLSLAACLAEDAEVFLPAANNAAGYIEKAAALNVDDCINNMQRFLILAAQAALLAAQELSSNFFRSLMPKEEEGEPDDQ